MLGSDRVWVDVSRHKDRRAEGETRWAVAVAESLGVPIVATGDVRHARPADRPLQDALTCLRHHVSLDAAGRRLAPNAERHLASPREMARRFADRPAWIAATRAIAERCSFRLHDLGYRFPTFPAADGESEASCCGGSPGRVRATRYGRRLSSRVPARSSSTSSP